MKSTHDNATKERFGRAFVFAASVTRVTLALLLSAALAFVPLEVHFGNSVVSNGKLDSFVNLEKSEAQAVVPLVGAAAGGAALAAELGVSTQALFGATMAVVAVGAGVGIETYNPGAFSQMFDAAGGLVDDLRTNAEKFNATYYADVATPPGFKTWDELTDDEKAVHGTAAGYAADCWFTLETEIGMTTTNGGAPTEPPEDPEQRKIWQKGRNILTLLAVGGAVGVGELANWLSNAAADGLYNLIFGKDDGLGLELNYTAQIGNYSVKFITMPYQYMAITRNNFTNKGLKFNYDEWVQYRNGPTTYYSGYATASGSSFVVNTNDIGVKVYSSSHPDIGTIYRKSGGGTLYGLADGGSADMARNISGVALNADLVTNPLNALYRGTYYFYSDVNGSNLVCQMANGQIIDGDVTKTDVEYPTIPEVPTGLPGAVVNNPEYYNNWFNNYENPDADTKRAVTLPDYVINPDPNGENRTVNYPDFIVQKPSSDVDPVPDTEPVTPGQPDPDPDTPTPDDPSTPDTPDTPDGDWDFPDEIGDALNRLGRDGFGNLFPFCLIYDLQALGVVMTGGSAQVNRDGTLTVQSSEEDRTPELHLPLSGFGIEGIDDIAFDLTSVFDMGHMLKPFWTVLFTSALLAFTLRVFIV